jgi:hypothetical protein
MENIKQKVKDLELALNYVCYNADLIPRLQPVWRALEALQEVVNNNCVAPPVSGQSEERASEQLKFLIDKAVEKEKADIRQWLLDEGFELLSEKL